MTAAGAPLAFAIIFSNLRNALTFFLAQPRRNGLDAEHGKPPVSSNPSDPGNGASAMPPPPEPAVGRLLPRSPRAALEPERVPLPKRRSKRVRHPVVIVGNAIFTAIILLTVAVGAALFFGKQRFDAPGPLAEDKVVNIARGSGPRTIAEQLEREGVIDQPWVFLGGVIALKARGELKSGEYKFEKHASIADVVELMIEGKVIQHAFTVPEGLTSEQVVARLLADDALTGPIKEIPHEGTLLPETYRFTRGMTREQLIRRMEQESARVLSEVWQRRSPDLPIKSPAELLTLASIVEKETGKASERSRVAAVFVNRLKRKMRLQSDPTIIYGLFGGKGKPVDRPIYQSDIQKQTPYNTYVINGLPPTPIANPGRAALEAVANPSKTDDLYFVADGTGGHVFAATLDEHNENVARYRALQKKQADDAAKAAAAGTNGAADKPAGDKPADGSDGTGGDNGDAGGDAGDAQ